MTRLIHNQQYEEEFVSPMVRLLNDASEIIVFKILEVLSKITVTGASNFGMSPSLSSTSSKNLLFQQAVSKEQEQTPDEEQSHPMTDANASFALGMLDISEKDRLSRNREVFAALIHTHSLNPSLLSGLSRILRKMCLLQPPEFIYISFGFELNNFVSKLLSHRQKILSTENKGSKKVRQEEMRVAKYLHFVSKFVQVMINVLLTAKETERCRCWLKDCISEKGKDTNNERKEQLFHILLNTFAHDSVAAISLCLWCGAYRTASSFLHSIDPLDLDLFFYLELDHLIEFIESRPLFRDLHLKMLETDEDPTEEGSSAMLYRLMKSILMILPQSTSYRVLQKRLLSVARFRQCAVHLEGMSTFEITGTKTEIFVHRILEVRKTHLDAKWRSIRSESLEPASVIEFDGVDTDASRRDWLGYRNEQDEEETKEMYKNEARRRSDMTEHSNRSYFNFFSKEREEFSHENEETVQGTSKIEQHCDEGSDDEMKWKHQWSDSI